MAVFKIEDCAEEYMEEIMRRVSRCVANCTIDRPGHMVSFRGVVNDTDVPDLAVREELREISFNWRAMFSQFLAEAKLRNHYMRQNVYSFSIFPVRETSPLTHFR